MKKVEDVAYEVKSLKDTGVSVGVVVGAGNIWRGRDAKEIGMDRVSADHMGMLGTILNAMALSSTLELIGVKSHLMSAIPVGHIVEPYNRNLAIQALEKGEVVVFGGGTGSPFFSTDTTAALRAAEVEADAILMAKKGVDGVYDCDPAKNKDAVMFEKLDYIEVIQRKLSVMDSTAISLCMDNKIPIVVFNIDKPGNILRAALGEEIGTLVGGK